MESRRDILKQFLASALLSAAPAALAAGAKHAQNFTPPGVLTVTDIPYPATTVAAGVVTVAVNLDEKGGIMNVQTLRDIPTLTTQATLALQNWTYSPANLNGAHVPSTLIVHIVFDPAFLQINSIPLGPPETFQPPKTKAAAFSPSQLLTATFPPYPSNGRGAGAVVLDVGISNRGAVDRVVVVRDIPSLTAAAEAALKNWTFSSAIYGNTQIASKVTVAMVFRNPKTALP
jgi:outer membrane biosynthesis protein TonB